LFKKEETLKALLFKVHLDVDEREKLPVPKTGTPETTPVEEEIKAPLMITLGSEVGEGPSTIWKFAFWLRVPLEAISKTLPPVRVSWESWGILPSPVRTTRVPSPVMEITPSASRELVVMTSPPEMNPEAKVEEPTESLPPEIKAPLRVRWETVPVLTSTDPPVMMKLLALTCPKLFSPPETLKLPAAPVTLVMVLLSLGAPTRITVPLSVKTKFVAVSELVTVAVPAPIFQLTNV